MSSQISMSNAKAMLSVAASVAASAMVVRSITQDFLPDEFRHYISSSVSSFFQSFSTEFTVVIEELQGFSLNQMFEAAEIYLGSKVTGASTRRVRLCKAENERNLAVNLDKNEEIDDVFENIKLKWRLTCLRLDSKNGHRLSRNGIVSMTSEVKYYELRFPKKHKERIFNSYLPYILERSKVIKQEAKAVNLYHTVDSRYWQSHQINFEHPMTFSTLAMDSQIKKALLEDLDNFAKGKEYHKRTGKAWKRGYLLYGPPGTGKTSLIAAMANYLKYDIYNLDLTAVKSNTDLTYLLLSMHNQSILVLEDIDCSINLENRESERKSNSDDNSKVTLSGLLNFIDGLCSCCGEERIVVFTTNHKDRLDPALLRPGRMDVHIHMSYCSYSAFKLLALNYLGISQHKLFSQIELLLEKAEVTPAEVAGELMKNTHAEVSLHCLLKFLRDAIMNKETQNGEEEYQVEDSN